MGTPPGKPKASNIYSARRRRHQQGQLNERLATRHAAHERFMGPDTEYIFGDEFWAGLSVAANALATTCPRASRRLAVGRPPHLFFMASKSAPSAQQKKVQIEQKRCYQAFDL